MKEVLRSTLISILILTLIYTFFEKIILKDMFFMPLITMEDNFIGSFHPNQKQIYHANGYKWTATFNKDGYRDNTINSKCEKKILLLGDSQVLGWGLSDEQTISSKLQNLLSNNGYCYEVINLVSLFFTIGDMHSRSLEKLFNIENIEFVFLHFYFGDEKKNSQK